MITNATQDLFSRIALYENGELNFADEVELFQELLGTGVIYSLRGVYHRRMQSLIDYGLVVLS
jgi:hypothetical protein